MSAVATAIEVAQIFKTGHDAYKDFKKSDSLISYTNTCRVEPITLIDEKCKFLPFLGDVLQTAHSIFAGYYLQAVSLEAVIGSVQVIKRLDKFSPSREAFMPSFEDFKNGLPKYGIEADPLMNTSNGTLDPMMGGVSPTVKHPGTTGSGNTPHDDLQAARDEEEYQRQQTLNNRTDKKYNDQHMTGYGDSLKTIKDASNMAVGKIIEITLTHEDRTLTLPIAIRLNTKTIDNQSLLHILGQSVDNKSAKARYHGWRSGELEFWKDIVFMEDLIKAHRTTLAKDKTGTYAELRKRATNNANKAVMSGEFSVGTASAITIISDSTRKDLEFRIGGKLSDFKTRQRVFEDCYMMLLFVIDAEYEHCTIYHRGLSMSTDMSLREMKLANKNDSGMITDVLKAFVSGHAVSF